MNSKAVEHLRKRQKILDGRQGRKYKRKTDRQAKRQRQNRKRKPVSVLTSLTYRAEERTDQSDSRKAKKRQSKASKKRVRGGSRDREQSSSSIPLHDTKAACITVLPVTSLQLQPNFHRVWVRNMHICVCARVSVYVHTLFFALLHH